MSKILKTASAVAIAASTLSVLMASDVGLAYDQIISAAQAEEVVEPNDAQQPVDQALPAPVDDSGRQDELLPLEDSDNAGGQDGEQGSTGDDATDDQRENPVEAAALQASSLRDLVSLQTTDGQLDREMQCLAGAVYFESKGESLKGQLAVARVVIARAQSSRFPDSYCGVVYQRKQFSFVRGGKMPRIRTNTKAWANAKAIAQIADGDAWKSPAEGALFFHASHVNPGWRLTRMAQIDNHIFYR